MTAIPASLPPKVRSVIRWIAGLLALLAGTGEARAQAFFGTNAPPVALKTIDVTSGAYGASAAAADNATALQAAINAAITAGAALIIPATAPGTCYKYTAPLTIAGDLTIIGSNVGENWNGGINVPLGSPPLNGAVLCPTSNGSDAISITGTSRNVNIRNLGLLFQTPFVGTGDGIHYVPAQNIQGLSGSLWENVIVYGHDGSHYGANLGNMLEDTLVTFRAYGGGVLSVSANSTTGGNYGNSTFIQPYGQVVAGGTAHGFSISANVLQRLNLLTFVRPQAITDSIPSVSPGGNPPTSAQDIWHQDANATNVRVVAADFESNVSSSILTGAPAQGNDMDWSGLFTTAATLNTPAWGSNGIMFGPQTRNYNDTTSAGATGVTAVSVFPGTHISATSATTYSVLATLLVAPPIATTNVTATRNSAIYSTGEIFTTSDLGSTGGAFVTGTTQINHGGSAVTNIGDNGATGLVTLGGTGNVVLNAAVYGVTALNTNHACNAGLKGATASVTDALAPTYLGTLTAGGTVFTPVVCNGTAWVSY